MDTKQLINLLEAKQQDIINSSGKRDMINKVKSQYADSMQLFNPKNYGDDDAYDTKMISFSTQDIKEKKEKSINKTKTKDTPKPKDQKIRFIKDLGYLGIVFDDLPKLHSEKAKENAMTLFSMNEFNKILKQGDVLSWPKVKIKNIYINEKDLLTGRGNTRLVDAIYPNEKTLDKTTRTYIKHKTQHNIPYGYVNFTMTRSDNKPLVIKDNKGIVNTYIPMVPSHNDLVGAIKLSNGGYAVLVKVSHLESPILVRMTDDDYHFLYMTGGESSD